MLKFLWWLPTLKRRVSRSSLWHWVIKSSKIRTLLCRLWNRASKSSGMPCMNSTFFIDWYSGWSSAYNQTILSGRGWITSCCRIALTNELLPQPDGPDTIHVNGCNSFILSNDLLCAFLCLIFAAMLLIDSNDSNQSQQKDTYRSWNHASNCSFTQR